MTAITYVIVHPAFRAVKVGYTSDKSNRLEYLARHGWEPYRHLVVSSGAFARQIEQATLFEIRFRLYVPPYLTDEQLIHGGRTETSSLGLISASAVWDIACEQAGLIHLMPTVGRGRWLRVPLPNRRRKGDTPPYSPIARTQARLERITETARQNAPRKDS